MVNFGFRMGPFAAGDLAGVLTRVTSVERQLGRLDVGDDLLKVARQSLQSLENGFADTNAALSPMRCVSWNPRTPQ